MVNVHETEEQATRCLLLLQQVIDVIRQQQQTTTRLPTKPYHIHRSDHHHHHQLIHALQECHLATRINHAGQGIMASSSVIWDNIQDALLQLQQQHNGEDTLTNRQFIVFHLLLPLLVGIGQCYEILDQVPAVTSPTTTTTTTTHQQQQKPIPPVGLLSIQHYTNVAVAVELVVCWSMVWQLDKTIGLPLQQRILPKALQGRLPRSVLTIPWDDDDDDNDSNNASQKDDDHHHSCDPCNRCCELALSTLIVGHLLCLERFRPMLLPRHLTDLYASMVQVEHYHPSFSDLVLFTKQNLIYSWKFLQAKLSVSSSNNNNNNNNHHDGVSVVDAMEQAQTWQTLLAQGIGTTPLWFRRRANMALMTLAHTNVLSLIHVFVRNVIRPNNNKNDDASTAVAAAAQRLARVLMMDTTTATSSSATSATSKDSAFSYGRRFMEQVMPLLDDVIDGDGGNSAWANLSSDWSIAQLSLIYTIWAMIEEMAHRHSWMVQEVVLQLPSCHTMEGKVLHETVRRLCILFRCVPPFVSDRVMRLLFLSPVAPRFTHAYCTTTKNESGDQYSNLTFLNLLFRLATLSSVVHSILQQDAVILLQSIISVLLSNMVLSSIKKQDQSNISGHDLIAVALVHALAPCRFDVEFRLLVDYYHVDNNESLDRSTCDNTKIRQQLCWIKVEKITCDTEETHVDATDLTNQIEQRVMVLVQRILKPNLTPLAVSNESTSIKKEEELKKWYSLTSNIFLILLRILFPQRESSTFHSAWLSVFNEIASALLVPLVALPILCEECPIEALFAQTDGAISIFQMMKIVFDSTAALQGSSREPSLGEAGPEPSSINTGDEATEMALDMYSLMIADNRYSSLYQQVSSIPTLDSDILVSICSILLSLLTAMLELGANRRSEQEEQCIQTFRGSLEMIARTPTGGVPLPSEVSQMASHSLALLGARGAFVEASLAENGRSSESVNLSQIEKDLRSPEPPLRARGVVSLQHLALALANDEQKHVPNVLIDSFDDACNQSPWKLLYLAIEALKDKESYVYLAAVQTVATLLDAIPHMVDSTSLAISTGVMLYNDESSELSLDQRAKLAEALIHFLRRQASLFPYLENVLELMLQNDQYLEKKDEEHRAEQIQIETHNFFLQGQQSPEEREILSAEEIWDEVTVRVKAGGPLFALEEADVIRASKIMILSELVSDGDPAIVAPYCYRLLSYALHALRLDSSRPVRRAAALLARSLYEAVVAEKNCILASSSRDAPFSVSMVRAREDLLAVTLQRCKNMDDLRDVDETTERLYDPTTISRCEEALAYRAEAEDSCILDAARLVVEDESAEGVCNLLRTLREATMQEDGVERRGSLIRKFIEEM